MKYSILIPSHDPAGKNQQMVSNLLASIDQCSVGADYELIIRKNGKSYTESHNDALRSSRGDYIIVLNDDVLIQDLQWLEKLTDDESIVSWREGQFGARGNEPIWDFACWAMSRPIFEKVGYFDESFKDGIGFEDNDYVYRARECGVGWVIRPIDLIHFGSKVLFDYYGDKQAERQKNHVLFNTKWPTLNL